MNITENQIISGRYRILEIIGSGGMANVYKALDEQTNKVVALKILKEEHITDTDFLRRFEQEAKAVLSLSHPNIVHSFDVGKEEEINYIVLEYVEGCTLKDIIKEDGPLTPKEAASIVSQVLDALDYAHSSGIIHRDVKPQNVLITGDGTAMLTDFGIARDASSTTRTFAGTNVIGSVHYLSPEQARGEQVGPESDIYSCGIMLYEMLTGQVPFGGENSVAIALKHLQENIKPPYLINSKIPRALSDVVVKATAKKQEMRYQTAAAMRSDIWRALREPRGKFARIVQESAEGEKEAPPRKKTSFTVGNIALMVVLVLGLFSALFFTVRAMQESKLINNKNFVVPALLGKRVEEAKELAALRGFNVVESDVKLPDEQYAEGLIIKQTPSAGTSGKKGDSITVVVSSGSDYTVVPDLKGKSLQDAMEAVSEADLKLNDPIYMASELPDGQIFNQDPVPETSVFKDDAITIWISGQEDMSIDMPQLIGMTKEEAIDSIIAEGFNMIRIYPITPESGEQENEVVKQAPSASMSVAKGTTVELYVGRAFLGDFAADFAVNVDIADTEKTVLVAAQIADNIETVLYSGTLPVGDQQAVSFTAYLPLSGEYTCNVYINGEKVKSSTAVFAKRKAVN